MKRLHQTRMGSNVTGCHNFAQLRRLAQVDVDYRIRHRRGASGLLVMAPHAGGIEPGTGRIADALAGREHAFYCLEGLKASGNRALHIASSRFDEPRAERMLAEATWVLSIHGCRETTPLIWVGGGDTKRARDFIRILQQAGWPARPCLRSGLHGRRPDNICNRGRARAGIQLEISQGLRRIIFGDLSAGAARRPLPFFHRLVETLRMCLAG
jgi:phage replication-related protein YjqB (UPF0714/DUF867 family)